MRDPRAIWTATKMPRSPDRDSISELVVDQAWDIFEDTQTVAREVLKETAFGRRLLGRDSVDAADIGRAELQRIFAPLVDRIFEFSKRRIEQYRDLWSKRRRGRCPGQLPIDS